MTSSDKQRRRRTLKALAKVQECLTQEQLYIGDPNELVNVVKAREHINTSLIWLKEEPTCTGG